MHVSRANLLPMKMQCLQTGTCPMSPKGQQELMMIDRNKPVLRTLLTGTPNAHEISVSSHPQVLGQVHCIQHLTPGTLGNAIRKSSDTSERQFSKFSKEFCTHSVTLVTSQVP